MGIFEILAMSVALSMDACAVGMGDGMAEPKISLKKSLLIGGAFGFFQFFMPVIGYFIADLIAGIFLQTFEKIAGLVAFILLAFLGGKMAFECVCEVCKRKKEIHETGETEGACACSMQILTPTKLFLQSIATSIDALAVGVTLKMATLTEQGLALGVWGATICIGVITFVLSVCAVHVGKKLGDKLADKANLCGGIVLIVIGLKLLIESLL